MAQNWTRTTRYGSWILLASCVAALVTAAVGAFNEDNGIAHSGGAYLVLVSTALLLVGSLVLALYRSQPTWLTVILAALVFLDLVGTGFAAYFLEARVLIALIIFGLVGWLVYLLLDSAGQDVLVDRTARRSS